MLGSRLSLASRECDTLREQARGREEELERYMLPRPCLFGVDPCRVMIASTCYIASHWQLLHGGG